MAAIVITKDEIHFSQDAVPSSTSVAWTLSRLTTAFKDIPS